MATLIEVPSSTIVSQGAYINDGVHMLQHLESDGEGASVVASPAPQVSRVGRSTTQPADPISDESEEEVRPRKERRIKGRRRAINPLPHVESALRRQQELKTNFRTLARPLKLILREMAQRSIDDMENDPQSHEQVAEAETIKNSLCSRLDHRRAHLELANQLEAVHLKQTLAFESDLCREHCQQGIEAIQERALESIEREVVLMHRQLRFEHDRASQETDTEAEPLPSTLDLKQHQRRYDSHLRHAVSPTRAVTALHGRARMKQLLQLQGLLADEDFTVMDPIYRDLADARRDTAQALDVLLRAGGQVDALAREHNVSLLTTPSSMVAPLLALANAAISKPVLSKRPGAGDHTKRMPPPSTPTGKVPLHKSEDDDEGDTASRHSNKRSTRQGAASARAKRAGNMSNGQIEAGNAVSGDGRLKITGSSLTYTETPVKEERHSPSPPPQQSSDDAIGRLRTMSLPTKSAVDNLIEQRSELQQPMHAGDSSITNGQSSTHPQHYNEPYVPHYEFGQRPHHEWHLSGRSEALHSFDRLFSRYQQSSQEPLASPFFHRHSPAADQSQPAPLPPGPGFDTFRFRTIDFNPRETQPPMPPTAPPVNHFANIGHHRPGFSSILPPMPPPLQMSPTIQSPLVALPQPRNPQTQAQNSYSFFAPPPPPPQHRTSQDRLPMLQPLLPGMQIPVPRPSQPPPQVQYGGPMLAPAPGLTRAAQPAFAQQLDRQEQNRRRNTDGGFPRFRPYHGPNQG